VNWALLGGSLVAVLALALTARLLGLGGDARLSDESAVRSVTEAYHFEPQEIALDRAGFSALARDAAGGFMLVRRHGAHFIGERLSPPLSARLDQRFLTIGRTVLDLGEAAPVWAANLRRLA
jgi:hypothetical protein